MWLLANTIYSGNLSLFTTERISMKTENHLSEFQIVKFRYMFSAFFDIEEVKYYHISNILMFNFALFISFIHLIFLQNGLIERNDILAFGDRLCKFTGWKEGSDHRKTMRDILNTFYECVKDQVKAEYLSKLFYFICMPFI